VSVVASRESTWRPDIQGLRGVAVLLVVAFHAGLPLPGGFTGVDVFFVISGFVITGLLMRQTASKTGFSFRSFYLRRARRLTPALAVMLLVVVIASIALESPFGSQQVTGQTAIGAAFIVANFVLYLTTGGYFDAPAEANPLLNTWSLSVEEQFYLIFPALFVLGWILGGRNLLRRGRSVLVTVFTALGLLSLLASIALTYALWTPSFIAKPEVFSFYSPFTRAWEFAAGAVLAVIFLHPPIRWKSSRQVIALVGLVGVLLSALLITDATAFPGFIALLPVLATVAIIGAGPDTWIARSLSTRIMVWLGAISYSWYLWHWPFITFARGLWPDTANVALFAAVVSLVPAWLSLKLIENPIRFGQRLTNKQLIPILVAAIATPALIGWGVLRGADQLWGNQDLQAMAAQVIPLPQSFYAGCASFTPLGERDLNTCTWNSQYSGAPTYLIGDSHAGALTESMISATNVLRRPLVVADAGSCPMGTALPGEPPLSEPSCEQFVDESLRFLTDQSPTTIVIGISPAYFGTVQDAQLIDALTRTVQRLREAGHTVVIAGPVPQFPQWWPWSCTLIEAWRDTAGCGASKPRNQVEEELRAAEQGLREVATRSGARIVPLLDSVCAATECATNDEDFWIFRDGLHISIEQSKQLGPLFAAAISEATS